jgi:hypothetical protein
MRFLFPAVVAMLLAGCATVPDVTVSYFPPVAESTVTVVQTVACNKKKNDYRIVASGTISTTYVSDRSVLPYAIKAKDLDGSFSNTDATFSLTEDGRLKGVNVTSTGVGEEIVKAGIGVMTPLGILSPAVHPICAAIDRYGDGKALTVTTSGKFRHVQDALGVVPMKFEPEPSSQLLYNQIEQDAPNVLLKMAVEVGAPERIPDVATAHTLKSDESKITLRSLVNVPVTVKAAGIGAPLISQSVLVPSTKFTYDLPLPKTTAFGKNLLELSLSDAGAITSIHYGKENGLASSMNAASSIVTELKPKSASEQAAQLQARADVIAQQQRLAVCLAEPASCK